MFVLRVLMTALLSFIILAATERGSLSAPHETAKPNQVTAVYVSSAGECMTAIFDLAAKRVTVTLPGGRTVTLPSAISASGARYSEGGETFWEHQGIGRFFKGEEIVFEGGIVVTAEHRVGRGQNKSNVDMKVGDTLIVSLPGNPTTGYDWKALQIPPFLQKLGESVFNRDSSLTGAGGIRTFKYVADRPGSGELRLIYHRSWEKKKPTETFSINIKATAR